MLSFGFKILTNRLASSLKDQHVNLINVEQPTSNSEKSPNSLMGSHMEGEHWPIFLGPALWWILCFYYFQQCCRARTLYNWVVATWKPLTSNSKTHERQVIEKFELNVIFCFYWFDRVSLCSPGCSRTCYAHRLALNSACLCLLSGN